MAHAFHEASVAGQHEGVVIHHIAAEASRQFTFGECHAYGVGEALAEWAGGHFHTGGVMHFRVAGSERAPLPERLQIVEFEAIARQEQQ